ncbi:hypothetical protein [Undibacterium squillarum]|uniref:Class IIb bacteriocin, lactobin A/cerein 7B family n=1 Tax=Undibacterium squillarum TaxID=1131567 RepID=A0ABQ2XZ33_9BURK|nr:hypothetical protein [Undibacterium squillarum]GGX44938.1 hypothetical protein GCM10010946_24400 [Undibacterium squillarum]
MQELKIEELEQIHGGDGNTTAAGIVVGGIAGLLVVGTGGAFLGGAILGGIIWSAGDELYSRWNRGGRVPAQGGKN